MNFGFGTSAAVMSFGLFWLLNGWFQGMGFPPCGYLVTRDWRLCFHVPGAMALIGAVLLFAVLRDTPESMGLPPTEGTVAMAGAGARIRGRLRSGRDKTGTFGVGCQNNSA
ncbi:MAG: hypothetical protein LLG20_23305 [Acidobacteriales bacterium]|nr:hypothetical protein [Terriglobales bacterium]